MQKFLSCYSIRDENTTTMLEWTFLVWSHIPHTIEKHRGLDDHLHPGIEIYFRTELFYLKRNNWLQAAFLWFFSFFLSCACVCLCNNEREIKCFSLFVNLPDHGNGRFCVLKLVATSWWNCALERKVWMSKRSEAWNTKRKKKWMI